MPRMHATIIATTAAATALVMVFANTTAFAHARLLRATPAVGGTIHPAPNEVTLHFSEKIEAAFSSVAVHDAGGKQVDKADSKVDKKDRTILRVSLPPLEPGVYKVEWRALSADTHRVNGDFTFTVGE